MEKGGPWRMVMTVLGQRVRDRDQREGADTRNQKTQVRSRQSGNGKGRAEQEKLTIAHVKE